MPGILHSSSVYGKYNYNTPKLAFDGNFKTEFATKNEQNPYLRLDLGSVHSLYTMALYTRLNSVSPDYVLTNFTIEVDKTSQFFTPAVCYHYTGTKHLEVHYIMCNQPLEGQYVRIQVQANQSLIIRELEIYECIVGYFGTACEKCGNCRNSESCDKITGKCPNGCDLGITGDLCKAECDDGKYGYNCVSKCGNCKSNTVCDKKNGTCPQGCNHGFTGRLCKECLDGSYGANCEFVCGRCPDNSSCDKVNGTSSAFDGIVKGENCKTAIGYIVGLCVLAALLVVTAILMLVFYFQKQKYLKLYLDLDSARYASYEKENDVDVSDVVYEQPD